MPLYMCLQIVLMSQHGYRRRDFNAFDLNGKINYGQSYVTNIKCQMVEKFLIRALQSMELETNTRKCQKCQKLIYLNNYILHELRCKGSNESYILGKSITIKMTSPTINTPILTQQTNIQTSNRLSCNIHDQNFNEKQHHQKDSPQNKSKLQESKSSQIMQSGIIQIPSTMSSESFVMIKQSDMIRKPLIINSESFQQIREIQQSSIIHIPSTMSNAIFGINQQTKKSLKPSLEFTSIIKNEEFELDLSYSKSAGDKKFRCTQCGYMMTQLEMISHPQECESKNQLCDFCNLQFPHDIMWMHKQICKAYKNTDKQDISNKIDVNKESQIERELERLQQQTNRKRAQIMESLKVVIGDPIPANIVPVSTQTFFQIEPENSFVIKRVVDSTGRAYEEKFLHDQQQNQLLNQIRIIVPNYQKLGVYRSIPTKTLNKYFKSGISFMQQVILSSMRNLKLNKNVRGLRKQQVSKLPCVKYLPALHEDVSWQCSICMNNFQEDLVVVQLPCKHLFDIECIIPWLKNSGMCPDCCDNMVNK